MSNQYASLTGFVQFDPARRDVNGKSLFEFMVRAIGFQGQPLVKVTLWPELQGDAGRIFKGTYVAVDGKYSQNESGGKLYHNLSASSLFVGDASEADESANPRVTNPVNETSSAREPW